jgi:ParB family chromosome partitioning protein
VLQPVLVRRADDGFQLIAGSAGGGRRAAASPRSRRSRDSDDVTAVEEALVENLHRADLTARGGAAYLQLIETSSSPTTTSPNEWARVDRRSPTRCA